MKYSTYNRIKRYIKRELFRFLFARKFAHFGHKVSIIDPDIIEGEEYIFLGTDASLNSKAWLLALKQGSLNPQLIIEDGATIGRFSHIVAVQKVCIGKNVLIADKVYISDNIHGYESVEKPIMHQPIVFKGEVFIGENSWIGENVSIVGAKVGKHCVIGANSVVTKDIPDYCIAVGSPAKIIKMYDFKVQAWIRIQ